MPMLARDEVDTLSIERRGPPARDEMGGEGSGLGEGESEEGVIDLREGVLMEDVLREREDKVRGRTLVEAPNAEEGGEVADTAGSSASALSSESASGPAPRRRVEDAAEGTSDAGADARWRQTSAMSFSSKSRHVATIVSSA